jgi:hypothetical protein
MSPQTFHFHSGTTFFREWQDARMLEVVNSAVSAQRLTEHTLLWYSQEGCIELCAFEPHLGGCKTGVPIPRILSYKSIEGQSSSDENIHRTRFEGQSILKLAYARRTRSKQAAHVSVYDISHHVVV